MFPPLFGKGRDRQDETGWSRQDRTGWDRRDRMGREEAGRDDVTNRAGRDGTKTKNCGRRVEYDYEEIPTKICESKICLDKD